VSVPESSYRRYQGTSYERVWAPWRVTVPSTPIVEYEKRVLWQSTKVLYLCITCVTAVVEPAVTSESDHLSFFSVVGSHYSTVVNSRTRQ
jgi:hypothetical protein